MSAEVSSLAARRDGNRCGSGADSRRAVATTGGATDFSGRCRYYRGGGGAAAAFAGIVGTGLAIAATQNRGYYGDSYGYYGDGPAYYGGRPAYYGGGPYYGGYGYGPSVGYPQAGW